MDTAALKNTLCAFIGTDVLGGMTITSDEELLLSDLMDSLGVMRLVAFMEDTWNISIPPDDVVLDTMQTVDAMAVYLVETHKVAA